MAYCVRLCEDASTTRQRRVSENHTTDCSSRGTFGELDAVIALRPGGRVVEAVHLCELLALSSWGLEGTDSRYQTEKSAWSLHGR